MVRNLSKSNEYLRLLYKLDETDDISERDEILDQLYDLMEDGLDVKYIMQCYNEGITV